MLRRNFLKEKLESGKTVIGTWAVIPSPITADIIASTGIDFIIIDAEHGPLNFETAQNMVIACESRNVSPVMRLGSVSEANILRALDIGVHCLQIPNISTVEEAKKLIRNVKYPPEGNRGFSPFTRAGNYSIESAKELTKAANENVLVAIHIEGREAIENIDTVIKIKGIDIIFLGLFDISKSMGIPGDVTNPKLLEIVEQLTQKINKSGKYPGTIVNNIGQLRHYLEMGVRYITYSVDCDILRGSYGKILNEFNELIDAKRLK